MVSRRQCALCKDLALSVIITGYAGQRRGPLGALSLCERKPDPNAGPRGHGGGPWRLRSRPRAAGQGCKDLGFFPATRGVRPSEKPPREAGRGRRAARGCAGRGARGSGVLTPPARACVRRARSSAARGARGAPCGRGCGRRCGRAQADPRPGYESAAG